MFFIKKAPAVKDYVGLYNLDGSLMKKRRQKNRPLIDKSAETRNGIIKKYIIPFWGHLRLADLTVKKVDDTLLDLGDKITGGHKNLILNILDDIYRQAIEDGYRGFNPIPQIAKFSRILKNPRNAIPQKEMTVLFPPTHDELLKVWKRQVYVTAYLVLRDTGLRPGELRALQWADWHSDIRFFPITKAIESGKRDKIKCTKTGSVKPAVVTEQTAQEIERLLATTKDRSSEQFIFSDKGGPFSIGRLAYNFKKGVLRAGLNRPEYSPYWLRHTFNTRMLDILPDETVRLLMGHATEAMTQHYRHPDTESLRREAEKIKKILDGQIISSP